MVKKIGEKEFTMERLRGFATRKDMIEMLNLCTKEMLRETVNDDYVNKVTIHLRFEVLK